jgi:hypothetical protein
MEQRRQVQAEEGAKRLQMVPRNRTTEEIWEELLELNKARARLTSTEEWDERVSRKKALQKELLGRMLREHARRLPEEVVAINEEISAIQIWLQKYEQLDDADKCMQRNRLRDLTGQLKIVKLREEKEGRLRQERLAREEALRKQKQAEIEWEARRQVEIQAALEKERLRKEAEAKLELEVKFRFLVWRFQTRWRYVHGRAFREHLPIPEPKDPVWEAMWEKWASIFREEDEAEERRHQEFALFEQGVQWQKQLEERRQREEQERRERIAYQEECQKQRQLAGMKAPMETWLA